MHPDNFESRHLGPNEEEIEIMLSRLQLKSIGALMDETIPESIRLKRPLNLPEGISEHQFLKEIQELGRGNLPYDCYIGMGYHPAITPAVIQRNILENPGWYTAYTPYQAEIAQGRLEAIFNFQTVVCDLTGLPIANASLLDESTAAAEAMSLLFTIRSREQKKNNSNCFFVDTEVLPQTLAVLQTRAEPLGINIKVGDLESMTVDAQYFGALIQYPGKKGSIPDLKKHIDTFQQQHIKVAVAADILSLLVLEAPGKLGAEVVVGSTQRFGIPLGYGGPHAAFFATKEAHKRHVPGRIIGQTRDQDNKFALRMALQTREQHIKRDRATSNICTAQVLLAVMAGMYAVYHGPKQLRAIAMHIHHNAVRLSKALASLDVVQHNQKFFDTLYVSAQRKAIEPLALAEQINLNYIDEDNVSIAINECTDSDDLEKLIGLFEKLTGKKASITSEYEEFLPTNLIREMDYLTHPVFNSHHSETALMRYIKQLERKDLALNQSMISLGSCTMKLNAAVEMLPLSWPQWNSLHPFVPMEQAQGYQKMLRKLEEQLNEVTGFAATSLQPNSGAQGEYSGLMVIRSYHQARGNHHRNICLIPASAHGTNPASAVMAGMKVVVTKADEQGNIDWEDISEKAALHSDNLAALMITYPSTHGVFESKIQDITTLIHQHGGQVYMDGANMNAQVGLTSPAKIGADVCHLNLHKTFAIPHGGGGPGVGPICVAAHLAPYLPSNPQVKTGGDKAIPAISAAPWGSALACLISYAYIRMLGSKGLQKATEVAILNANYIKSRLEGAYPILYTGEKGRAAHELIIDCRDFKVHGVEVTDIAKRLMDYGFHAPTVSFPVAGTMMIEPTESENLAEMDRFCDAMISIRMEIETAANEPDQLRLLHNAPHTQAMLTSDEWTFPYSRKKAAYPLPFVADNKFWPAVRRVDEAFGDRNLICSCTPISSYVES